MSGAAKLSRKPNATAAAPTVKAKTTATPATTPKTAKTNVKKIEMEIDESDEENGDVALENQEEQIIEVGFPNSLLVMDPERGGEIIESIGQAIDDEDDDNNKIADAAAALEESMQKTAPYREKLSPFVKAFVFNPQATEAKLAAAAEQPSTQEEADDDGGGAAQPTTGAKKKRAIAVADERIFDLGGDFLSMPFAKARMVDVGDATGTNKYAVVKYLNPKLPHLANDSITKSPVRVIYAGIKLAELPLSKATLGGDTAGSKDVAHALQRIGSRVYLGGNAIGGYVSFPGLCKSNFEELAVVKSDSPAFQRLAKPHAVCTAEALAAAATVVSLDSEGIASVDFFRVEPIRITQSAYVAHLVAQKELAQKQILKDEQLTKSSTRLAKVRLDTIESFIEFVTDGGEVEPSDNLILHAFLYREFDAVAVQQASAELFPSIFVAPEPGDVVSSEKALKAAVKHNDIFEFLKDNLNQTFVEITASPQYLVDDAAATADTVRFLVRVPIIPKVSWISLNLSHKDQSSGAAVVSVVTGIAKKTSPTVATAKSPSVPKKAAATTTKEKSTPSSQQTPAATKKTTTTLKTKKTVEQDDDAEEDDDQEAQEDVDEQEEDDGDDAADEEEEKKVAEKKNHASAATAKKATANVVEPTLTKANIAAATSAAATVEKLNNKKRKQTEQSAAAAFLEETENEVVALPTAVKGGAKGAPKASKPPATAAPPHEGPVDMDEDAAEDEENGKTTTTKGGSAAIKEKTAKKNSSNNSSSGVAAPVMSASGRGYDFNKNEDMYAELHELGCRTQSQKILYELLMRTDNMLETLPDDNKNVISKVMAARLAPEVVTRDMAPKEARDLAITTAQFLRLAGCGKVLKAFRDSEIDEVVTTREERAARLEKERLEAEELAKAEAEAIAQAEAARAEKEKAEKAAKAKAAKAKAAKEKAEAEAKAKAEEEAAAAAAAAAQEEEGEEEAEASEDFFNDA